MKGLRLTGILATGHGLNDLVAGYFLGSLLGLDIGLTQIATGLLVYNLLAFGGQYPVALWMEKVKSPRFFLILACSVNVCAILLFNILPHISIVLAGFASAVYHVAGGSVCAQEKKAFHIGMFAAPGVAGLIAGGYLAHIQIEILPVLIPVAVLFLFIMMRIRIHYPAEESPEVSGNKTRWLPDQHDVIMILLLTVISLRSAVWHIFQLMHEENYTWLISIAVAAFAGKIIGGWIADRVGWKLYTMVSLLISAPLITLCKNQVILFCIGVGLLQSGIPATTALMIQSVKGNRGRGIALSFGAAIVLGGFFLHWPVKFFLLSDVGTLGVLGFMGLLMYWYSRNKRGFQGVGVT